MSANAMTYAVGFVIATGLLHLSGIALGLLLIVFVRWRRRAGRSSKPERSEGAQRGRAAIVVVGDVGVPRRTRRSARCRDGPSRRWAWNPI